MPGGDARAGGAGQGRDGPAGLRRGGPGGPAADPGGGGGLRGGDRARRDRLPQRLGGQHLPPRGGGVRALRDDLLRPARHRAGAPADRGERPADRAGQRTCRGAAGARPGPLRHPAGGADPRRPRRARHLGAPGGRLRVRGGALPGPAGPRAGGGRGRQAVGAGRHLLQHRPGHRGHRARRARAAPGRRGHPGRVPRRHRRMGERARAARHRLRRDRARGAARPADRGARAGRAVLGRAEGLVRDAAQEKPDPVRADLRPGAGGPVPM